MDKLKYIKVEQEDGTLSENIPIGVEAQNVETGSAGGGSANLADYITQNNTNISNLQSTDTNLQTQINTNRNSIQSLASGSPLVASSIAEMIDTSRIYVNISDGNWYYYNGTTWVSGGIYQASVDTDMIKILQENDYDIARHIVKINGYSDLIQKTLIKPYDYVEKNNAFVKSKGISRISVTGAVATTNTIIVYGEPVVLQAGQIYTYACFDLEEEPTVSNCVGPYFCLSGTTTAYRINGDIVQLRCTTQDTTQLFKTFTPPETVTVVPTIYFGPNVHVKGTFRIFLVEGEYTQEDFEDNTILAQHLAGRVFKGTINPTTTIPHYDIPVFYLGKGPGPYPNFNGSTQVFADCSYIIFLNDIKTDTWTIYSLPLMTNDAITRTSITTFLPSSQEPITLFGQRKWGICCKEGTYTNFKDYNGNSLVLESGEVAIFSNNYDMASGHRWWHKDIINNATTKTYVDTAIDNALEPVVSDIESYIYTWLSEHPEATTTVQDGAITIAKLDSNLADKANKFRADNGSSTTWEDNNNDLNTIIGYNNMPNGIGSRNTIIGIDNLQANNENHSANKEVAIGYHALFRDWDGDHNVSIGNESMDNLSHGSYNTAVGSNALRVQRVSNYGGTDVEGETVNYNTAYGGDAMLYTYGDNNTALGYAALKGSTYGATGSNNVAIGYCAGRFNTNESDKLYIDNRNRGSRVNEITKSLIYGNFADDITDQFVKINGKFACNGATPVSARTAEANATDLASAITLLNQIKTVLIETGLMKNA